jgi:hypothetical protein
MPFAASLHLSRKSRPPSFKITPQRGIPPTTRSNNCLELDYARKQPFLQTNDRPFIQNRLTLCHPTPGFTLMPPLDDWPTPNPQIAQPPTNQIDYLLNPKPTDQPIYYIKETILPISITEAILAHIVLALSQLSCSRWPKFFRA